MGSGTRLVGRPVALGMFILGAVLALQGPGSPLHAQSNAGGAVLEIRVTDSSGLAVDKARVSVRSAFGGQPLDGLTDGRGNSTLTPQLTGRYVVLVRAPGFADESQTIDWREERTTLDIKLTVAGLQEQITVTSGSRVEELQQESPVKVEAVSRERMTRT